MNSFFYKVKLLFSDKTLKRRVLFTLAALALYRLLATIPVPGVDLEQFKTLFASSDFLSLVNLFSGGGFARMSIILLGVSPYITSSIIMQLLTLIFPSLKALYQDEGEAGRRKFTQYSRFLTVPLAVIQAVGFLALLKSQGVFMAGGFDLFVSICVVTAGSMFLTWIGELITEFGVGNGVSLIIFAGIVAALPTQVTVLWASFDTAQIPVYIALILAALATTYAVVVVTEAERPIPVTYAKQSRGLKTYGGVSTYLPIRLNQAGVIPIIFALSLLLFPQMILQFLSKINVAALVNISNTLLTWLNNQWLYAALYFVLVFFFTYFYTAVTFDPHKIAENLQKGGAFIPGVRPGPSTVEYLGNIVTRLTLFGAVFLSIIAVLPLLIRIFTNISALAIGGTALLIAVSVVIDTIKRLDAQVSMQEY